MDRETNTISLYDRLPEIYRVKDEEIAKTTGKSPLKAYLQALDVVFNEIYNNIEDLYRDLFIDTCTAWVIPYIGDLIGVKPLVTHDQWTQRADVYDTINLRRHKGTLHALESLIHNLTQWITFTVELKDRLLISQNINYYNNIQRQLSLDQEKARITTDQQSLGTVPIKNPNLLSLLNTPFDPFSKTVDTKPIDINQIRYNLPNLGIFLWRLENYTLKFTIPSSFGSIDHPVSVEENRNLIYIRYSFHPLGRLIELYNNSSKVDKISLSERSTPVGLTKIYNTPHAVLEAQLNEYPKSDLVGSPENLVEIVRYNYRAKSDINYLKVETKNRPFQIYLPGKRDGGQEILDETWEWPSESHNSKWTLKGGNLMCWESTLTRQLNENQIVIDPRNGRFIICVDRNKKELFESDIRTSYTYATSGQANLTTGAHPIGVDLNEEWDQIHGRQDHVIKIMGGGDPINGVLASLSSLNHPVIIEIQDSLTYNVHFTDITISNKFLIRSVDGHRPIISIVSPLSIKPITPEEASTLGLTPSYYKNMILNLNIRFEGLFFTSQERNDIDFRGTIFNHLEVNSVVFVNCTLDPQGHLIYANNLSWTSRSQVSTSIDIQPINNRFIREVPEIILLNCISGMLRIPKEFSLTIRDSLIDSGKISGNTSYAIAGNKANEFTLEESDELDGIKEIIDQMNESLENLSSTQRETRNKTENLLITNTRYFNYLTEVDEEFTEIHAEFQTMEDSLKSIRNPSLRLISGISRRTERRFRTLNISNIPELLSRRNIEDLTDTIGVELEKLKDWISSAASIDERNTRTANYLREFLSNYRTLQADPTPRLIDISEDILTQYESLVNNFNEIIDNLETIETNSKSLKFNEEQARSLTSAIDVLHSSMVTFREMLLEGFNTISHIVTRSKQKYDNLPSLELDLSESLVENVDLLEDNLEPYLELFEGLKGIYRVVATNVEVSTNMSVELVQQLVHLREMSEQINIDLDERIRLREVRESSVRANELNEIGWGPMAQIYNTTVIGQTKVDTLSAEGAIFTSTINVRRKHLGCIKKSYIGGSRTTIPQFEKCLFPEDINHNLKFTSVIFEDASYGQISLDTDWKIKEQGPDNNEMGAFGYLKEADKWRNLQIRLREFMPVGIIPNYKIVT